MLEPDDQALLIQLDMQAERRQQQHKGIGYCGCSNHFSLSITGIIIVLVPHS